LLIPTFFAEKNAAHSFVESANLPGSSADASLAKEARAELDRLTSMYLFVFVFVSNFCSVASQETPTQQEAFVPSSGISADMRVPELPQAGQDVAASTLLSMAGSESGKLNFLFVTLFIYILQKCTAHNQVLSQL
jgi:hypothetical protein